MEFAVVNEATGFVDYEEGEDDPVNCQTVSRMVMSSSSMLTLWWENNACSQL